MSLNDIVSVTITTVSTAPTRVGFGIPLVASYHTVFPERVRIYSADSAVADMVSDGFAATDLAVLAVTKILSQNPKPSQVYVGRTENDQKQKINLVPVAVNDTEYAVYINGQEASFTSDADATVAEITAGLKTDIDLLGENVTVTDNTTDLDIEANTVADAFSFYVGDRTLITQENITPDLGGTSGIADDLAAIIEANNDWYSLHLTNLSKPVISAAAAYIESVIKLFVCSSADDEIYDSGVSDDIGSVLNTAGYARTALVYHPKSLSQFAGAAWAGKNLPEDPGSITWKFKTLAGVDFVDLTPTEVSTLESKKVNHYTQIAGIAITQQGYASDGTFIDITRAVDWIRASLQENIYFVLANSKKIPYTNNGIAVIVNEVRGVLQDAVNRDVLAADPEFTVTAPLVSDVSITDKANRLLPDVEFEATLAGAIHSVQISGVISV